jgi:hypothetical protein
MSHQLISRSKDLKRLRDDGYDVEIRNGHLLIKEVPYVDGERNIQRGILVSTLCVADETTVRPDPHTVWFVGKYPCHRDGSQITAIIHSAAKMEIDHGLVTDYMFSSKPPRGYYSDYYEKMTAYANLLSGPAESLDPSVTAKTFPMVEETPDDSVFHYMDTASSRAGIALVTRKLEIGKIAIVGLGGTGAYVLDQVAKTPVKEIHLFDGDIFLQHNAFRVPGAPSKDTLATKPLKVDYLHEVYSKMHRGIVPHGCFIDESNVNELREMNFVFLCLDRGAPKRIIVEKLESFGVSFVEVGLGLLVRNDSIHGILRVTTSTRHAREHVHVKNRIPFTDGDGNDEYASNIQIADLNALNAALAVVRWKKLFGFYGDLDNEHFSTYTLDGNTLINEDQVCRE